MLRNPTASDPNTGTTLFTEWEFADYLFLVLGKDSAFETEADALKQRAKQERAVFLSEMRGVRKL